MPSPDPSADRSDPGPDARPPQPGAEALSEPPDDRDGREAAS